MSGPNEQRIDLRFEAQDIVNSPFLPPAYVRRGVGVGLLGTSLWMISTQGFLQVRIPLMEKLKSNRAKIGAPALSFFLGFCAAGPISMWNRYKLAIWEDSPSWNQVFSFFPPLPPFKPQCHTFFCSSSRHTRPLTSPWCLGMFIVL